MSDKDKLKLHLADLCAILERSHEKYCLCQAMKVLGKDKLVKCMMFGDRIIGRQVVSPWQVPDCSKTAVQINSDFFENTCESIVQ